MTASIDTPKTFDQQFEASFDEALSFSMFLGELIEIIEVTDGSQWLAGDKLQGVETRYADHTIESIADEVGKHPSTLQDWKQMAKFYDKATRAYYKEVGLYYSHLKVGMRNFETLESACEFLDRCVQEKWSVRGAQIEVKAFKGETVKPAPITLSLTFDAAGRVIDVQGDGSRIRPGARYTATLKEMA